MCDLEFFSNITGSAEHFDSNKKNTEIPNYFYIKKKSSVQKHTKPALKTLVNILYKKQTLNNVIVNNDGSYPKIKPEFKSNLRTQNISISNITKLFGDISNWNVTKIDNTVMIP